MGSLMFQAREFGFFSVGSMGSWHGQGWDSRGKLLLIAVWLGLKP